MSRWCAFPEDVSLPTLRALWSASLKYCKENYPAYTFSTSHLDLDNPVEDLKEITAAHKVDMMVMGTRRKNIFSRLFNPSWAHRLLFHTDMPIMSIPVQS